MTGPGGGPLRDAVRMEARRLTTARVTYLLVGLALLLGSVIALLIALVAPVDTPLAPTRTSAAVTAGGDAVPLSVVGGLAALLGVVTVGHDYRYGLLRAVLTAQPRRGFVVAARLAVLAGVAAAAAAAVSVLGAAVAWLTGRAPSADPATLRVAAAHVVLAVLWAWLGAGLAWVLRSSGGALALLLLGPLLVEPVLTVIAETEGSPGARGLVRWLPFAAARQALGRPLGPGPDTIGALAGTAVFAGVTVLVLALAWLLVQRRDA